METAAPQFTHPQPYGATNSAEQPITSNYQLQNDSVPPTSTVERFDDEVVDEEDDDEGDFDEFNDMSLEELIYSSSSYHAIAKPGE
jgi:hypothetical protein